jgi:hypothetical protein
MWPSRIFVPLLIFLAGARYANTQVGNLCAIVGTVRDASGPGAASISFRPLPEILPQSLIGQSKSMIAFGWIIALW